MTKNEYIKTQINLFSELLKTNKINYKSNQRVNNSVIMATPKWLYNHEKFLLLKAPLWMCHGNISDVELDILSANYLKDKEPIIANFWLRYNCKQYSIGMSYRGLLKYYITGLHILLASMKRKKHVQSDSENYQGIVSFWNSRCEEFADKEQTNDSPA
jgi:hypothetical protein